MSRVRGVIPAALLVWVLGLAPAANAWNVHGHMLSAALTYRELPPGPRAEVVRLLRRHPQWVQQEPAPLGLEDVALFMYAARWSDDIRGDSRWDHPEWHYINVPLTRDGVSALPPAAPNILTALEEARELLQKPSSADAEKAVALCWMFHLVGDTHQPLHTVSLFSALYPEGDRGGTRFYMRVAPGLATISLHYLWDNVLGQEQGIRSVWNRSASLVARPDLARHSFPELRVRDWTSWVDESVRHTLATVYPSGVAGSRDRTDGALLPTGYGKQAQALAEHQIVLAGYRLADLLAGLLKTD